MTSWSWLAGLCVLVQVPAPAPGPEVAQRFERERRVIIAREASELLTLAEQLAQQGKTREAEEVRAKLPPPVLPNGPTRFTPLPEVVAPEKAVAPEGVREIQNRAAADLFDLAGRAAGAESPRYALASVCLRAVLARDPDHKEARRLLGYVPHNAGWATPFFVHQLGEHRVNHKKFGWVPGDWLPNLDRGELPAPPGKDPKKLRWLPIADADRRRAGGKPPWRFATEHFDFQSNATLAEGIALSRRIEAFYDLFTALLADILDEEQVPLVRRFKDPTLTGDGQAAVEPHHVYYFGSKADFVAHLRPLGRRVAKNLGSYDPPPPGSNRAPVYFYRDPNAPVPEIATQYHEVSHQLLFETAGPHAHTENVGNYWVFEGLGTYFETVVPQDGSLEFGGLVGPRIEAAYKTLITDRRAIPIAEFVSFDESTFHNKVKVYDHYQQAMALTVFLMQWNQGAYRDDFLDYVRDAYHGRIGRGTGGTLESRLHQTYASLDTQFLAFLKSAKAAPERSDPAETKPDSRGAIRTVPSS